MDETLGVGIVKGYRGGEAGGSEHAFSNLHMNIKKGSGLGKNEQDDFCIPVLYSFLQ